MVVSAQLSGEAKQSRSGNGAHAWIFFEEPIPVALARRLGAFLITNTMECVPDIGFGSYDRFFSSQVLRGVDQPSRCAASRVPRRRPRSPCVSWNCSNNRRLPHYRCANPNRIHRGTAPKPGASGRGPVAARYRRARGIAAFGKTVLAIRMMAERGLNTLILVHRRQLMDQWIERLTAFSSLPRDAIGMIGGGRRNQRVRLMSR